jgi:hypothetical protein
VLTFKIFHKDANRNIGTLEATGDMPKYLGDMAMIAKQDIDLYELRVWDEQECTWRDWHECRASKMPPRTPY